MDRLLFRVVRHAQVKGQRRSRLVAHGLGISITPTRACVSDGNRLRRIRFGTPQKHRCLTMVMLERSPRQRLAGTLLGELQQLTAGALPPRP